MISFLPKVIFPEVTYLPPEYLLQRGIKLLMLDFDNTMLPYTTNVPSQALLDWISKFQKSSVQLCIVSNSKKPRVRIFSEQYGVDVIQGAKKPFSKGIKACLKKYGVEKSEAALVGDQIYTDVLGANCAGVYSVLVKSIHNHTFWLKLRHVAEVPFIFMAKGRKYKHEES
ncbi:MAG: YqeG family HAD IIIA-type phosphatase [Clostridia bacterium]|nr:YqeG family HAD IIIA-type phosphatase [Clostridia bacterium]